MSIARLLVLWLVMLALPLQGLASVRGLACHEAGPMATTAAQAGHHQHGDGHAAHHDDTLADHAAVDESPGVATTVCAFCAACCMTAAPAPTLPVVPGVEAATPTSVQAADKPPAGSAQRLERPPRQHTGA